MCKKELAVSIFKKGDLRDCNNWRGETLLPIISKIFHRVLLERITKGIDIYRGFECAVIDGFEISDWLKI